MQAMDDEAFTRWLMGDTFGTPGLGLSPDPPWFAEAACADAHVDPAWFFPEGRGRSPARAVAICNGCPVREQCARHADAQGYDEGVWGGTTPQQRAEQQHAAA